MNPRGMPATAMPKPTQSWRRITCTAIRRLRGAQIRKLEAMVVKLPERDSGALRLKEFATDALQGRALALAADGTTDLNSAVPAGTVAECSVSSEAGNRQTERQTAPLFHSRERGKANEIKWLGFLDAFRTLCIDSKGEIRSLFEELRTACHFVG